MGRRKNNKVWDHFEKTKEGKWKCKSCGEEYGEKTSATRLKDHIDKRQGRGIEVCTGSPQSNNFAGQVEADGDAKDHERIEVGSSSVSNWENEEDLQMMKRYVFECLRPEDKVIVVSPHSYLTQEEFMTLKPETPLDSSVIDIFVEILNKKSSGPSNWYLPMLSSEEALKGKVGRHLPEIKEKYMSDPKLCEKIFIPFHVGARPNELYLGIIHLKNEEVEIWGSQPNISTSEIQETTSKLLLAMEKLSDKVTFTKFHWKMADNILLPPNTFECGVFVINYMRQLDNYVKRNPLFKFDSQKEREDLTLNLLKNNLNQEKQNLYVKARRHYVHVEDVERGKKAKYDDLEKDHRKSNEEAGHIEVGSSSVSNRENVYFQILQYVFDCLSPRELVFRSPRFHLTQKEFSTLKPESYLDSWVIDIFADILTESEKKKATPSNWYLPVMFSKEALQSDESNFKDFVHKQKIREDYTSHIKLPEKVFIPVHTGPETGGHFYLYIFFFYKKVIEIWDSLANNRSVAAAERDETRGEKLLFAMEILLEKEKGAFPDYKLELREDILSQPNLFDCGIFVINYMQQSDDYMNPSFKFDSQKEREGLALQLLNSHLNQEKQNLYDKSRRHYAQVGKKDDNKRLRLDPSKQNFEHSLRDNEEEEEEGFSCSDTENEEVEEEGFSCSDTENDAIGAQFQYYTGVIREWINDNMVPAIGILGIGGSGKTTLASHIYDELSEEGDLKVIWVSVSQNSIYKLQKAIARSIKLAISDESGVIRIARKLFQAFKEMKKCVVILDDVWDHFPLMEVGLPISDSAIKLILTTRIWEVCQGMDCMKYTIKVKSLHRNYSQALFKKTMGNYEGLSIEVEKIARIVASECEGFPLAIVRIATSMMGVKHVGEWSHMLECLKNLGNGKYEVDKWVLPVLRSSYDFLTNKLQRFFLYCALSMKEYLNDDQADHLVRRFVYESIDQTKKLRVQYYEGHNMIGILKNHSMLESAGRGNLRMNKFVRALAISIAEDTCTIMANAYKNLTEIPSNDQWREDLQKVFLTGNKIQTILDGTCLRCSQLSTLLLDGNKNLNYISDDFFNNMPALKVLDLSDTHIKLLPQSVSNLECLNALLISKCKYLSFIPSLSKLKLLISLDLSDTAITEAPMGLESCVNIRFLNLMYSCMIMPASVISKLVNLELLLGLEVIEPDVQGLQLYKLEVIVAFFHDISVFNTCVSFLDKISALRSFHLILANANNRVVNASGNNREYCWNNSMKRIHFDNINLWNRRVALPRDIKELFINDCQLVGTVGIFLCKVISSNNPHQIDLLDIRGCKDVEYLFCFSNSCPFCSSSQHVGRLILNGLENLKDIVSPYFLLSLNQPSLFSHLTCLTIMLCNNMETVIAPKLLALLQNLHSIVISSCSKMKEIVVAEHHSQMELIVPITLPNLTSLKLSFMPELNFVYRGLMICPSLQTFSAYDCGKLNPPQIQISNGCELPMKKTYSGYSWELKPTNQVHIGPL